MIFKMSVVPKSFIYLVCCCCFSCYIMFNSLVTPWTVACHAPLSIGFFRQEYWSGLPFTPPGYLSNPGIEPASLLLQVDSLLPEPLGKS